MNPTKKHLNLVLRATEEAPYTQAMLWTDHERYIARIRTELSRVKATLTAQGHEVKRFKVKSLVTRDNANPAFVVVSMWREDKADASAAMAELQKALMAMTAPQGTNGQ